MRRIALRSVTILVAAGVIYFVLQRISYQRLLSELHNADYSRFLALMIPNTVLYVAWDTLVLKVAVKRFHGPVRYRHLLPVRAASYIVGLLNINAGRGALTLFIGRLLGQPSLQIGSTVIFLVLTEYMHLVAWASLGIILFGSELTRPLLWVPPATATVWLLLFAYKRAGRSVDFEPGPRTKASIIGRWLAAPWSGQLLRTFRLAPARQYVQIVILRAPIFFVSLCLHYFAAPAFGVFIPFSHMVTLLPIVFMVAALPITATRIGTTQAAWILLFGDVAPAERLLAFSLAAHLTFLGVRALLGIVLLPWAYRDLVDRRHLVGSRALHAGNL